MKLTEWKGNVLSITMHRSLLLGLALGLALAMLTGCAAHPWNRHGFRSLPTDQAVQERIALDARLEGAQILVAYDDGTATLQGKVKSLGQKLIAQEDLYEVKGVKRVVNELSVIPPRVPDDEIEQSILDAIPSHCLVETEGIHVDVQDGHVTLSGSSQRLHHKDVIMNIATFTRGVRSVENRIEVRANPEGAEGTDVRIRKNVEGVIASLPTRTRNIRVEVDHGTVTLTGKVRSFEQARLVNKAVRNVPGVVRVRNRLSPYMDDLGNFIYLGGF